MNDAHLHMVVNHFPIIGTILAVGVLLAGIFLKNNSVKNTAYILFIIAAIFAFFSMATGEGAEEMVEDMPNIGKQIIHEHEEIAEKLALVLYLVGGISILGLFMNIKNHANANFVSYIVLVLSLLGVFLAQKVGTSGGEIRHTEIRAINSNVNLNNENSKPEGTEKAEDNDDK